MPNTTTKYSEKSVSQKLESDLVNADKSVVKTAYSELVQEFDACSGVEESTYKAVTLSAIGNDERSSFNIYAAERSIGAVDGQFIGKSDISFQLSRNSSAFSGLNPVGAYSTPLAKQKSCEPFVSSRKTPSADAIDHSVNDQKPVKAKVLLWKFSDYAVASFYGFCSLDDFMLCEKIEGALDKCDVDFSRESDFSYSCQTVNGCSSVRFSIHVSLLQKACQEVIGDRYVVEMVKVACPSPEAWSSITAEVQGLLKNDIKFIAKEDQVLGQRRGPFTAINKDAESKAESPLVSSFCPILSKFLDSLGENEELSCNVEFACVFAEMSGSFQKDSEDDLNDSDINNIVSLLTNQCVDIRRAACIILRNAAGTGLLKPLSDSQKEDIVTSLARCIQSIAAEDKFTNRLKREAVKALGSMENILDSVAASSKDFARKTLVACAGSNDERLVRCAKEALSSSYFDSNVEDS